MYKLRGSFSPIWLGQPRGLGEEVVPGRLADLFLDEMLPRRAVTRSAQLAFVVQVASAWDAEPLLVVPSAARGVKPLLIEIGAGVMSVVLSALFVA